MAPLATETYTAVENLVRLYPNPASDNLNILISNTIELQKVSIYNLQGQQVDVFSGNQTNLNISKLKSGVYLVKIDTNQGTVNHQLIKK